MPRMPKTSRNSMTMRSTLMRAGMDSRRALTTVLIPSFYETALSGLSALKALKPLRKLMSPVA